MVYSVRSKSLVSLVLVLLLALPSVPFAFSAPLTVNTDGEVYRPGETVTINGSAAAGASVNLIVVFDSEVLYNLTVEADVNGSYASTLLLEANASLGEYEVTASSEGEHDETEFTVEDAPCELVSNLLSIIETSRNQTQTILNSLIDEGIEIPEEALEEFEKGNETVWEVYSLYEAGECESAADKAAEALDHFREAASLAMEAEEELEDYGAEEKAEKAIGLRVAIERAYSFLDKVNETAAEFEDKGLDVSDVRALLEEASVTLAQAESLLEGGDFDGAEDAKSEAREMLGQAMGLLHSKNKGEKADKALDFLEKTDERLDKLEEQIAKMLENLDLPPEAIEGIIGALQNAQDKIQVVKDQLLSGDLEGALDGLDDVLEDSDGAIDTLDEFDHGRGNKIRAIQKITAKLDYLNATLQALKEGDEDARARAEELLREARNLLSEASDGLEAGLSDEVEPAIDEAEELVEEVDDLLDELKEELEDREEEEEEREERLDDAEELREEIAKLREEALSLLEEVRELGPSLEANETEALLMEALELLNETGVSIDEGDLENAKGLLVKAKELIEQAARA